MSMDFTPERLSIIDAIGHGSKLRVKRRDELSFIVEATLFDPRTGNEEPVKNTDAGLLVGYRDTDVYQLRKMNPHRVGFFGGYVEAGCPEDGSEYYCLLQ